MAPRAGFEPATNRLTAGCSTAELPRNRPNIAVTGYNKVPGARQILKLIFCADLARIVAKTTPARSALRAGKVTEFWGYFFVFRHPCEALRLARQSPRPGEDSVGNFPAFEAKRGKLLVRHVRQRAVAIRHS